MRSDLLILTLRPNLISLKRIKLIISIFVTIRRICVQPISFFCTFFSLTPRNFTILFILSQKRLDVFVFVSKYYLCLVSQKGSPTLPTYAEQPMLTLPQHGSMDTIGCIF